MGIEATPWDAAEHLDSVEAILACLRAAFEGGDAGPIAAALNDVARARGSLGTLCRRKATSLRRSGP